MSPEVSVIITTYRRPALLAETIDSVLGQSYRNFEVIVVDDGSGDETAARVAAYGDAVHYLPLPHTGNLEVGRNRGAAAAAGRFLAFLDDDDLWHRLKLARQMALLENNEEAGYAYSDAWFLYEDGSTSAPVLSPRQREAGGALNTLLRGCFIYPSSVLMRREVFEQVGPFDETFGCQADYYLWLRAARLAQVVCPAEPLVYIRRGHTGRSERMSLRHVEGAILALERFRQRYPLSLHQDWLSRRTLSRFYAHLGLRRASPAAARQELLRSVRLNPLQRAAWAGLLRRS